jgi:E3 ubiquitin-protein ligase MYCBP2
LRIRSHPSLQSEQIGVVPVNGVIEFTQEVHNDDGIWVKLDESSLYAYCEGSQPQTRNFRVEGWCLQYNQHVGRTLLFPIEAPKRLSNNRFNDKNNLVSLRRPNDPTLPYTDR